VTHAAPTAVRLAQDLIWQATDLWIPEHRIGLDLSTEPDQYRVSWISPSDGYKYRALVPRITLTPEQFEAWQSWLDSDQGDDL